MRKPCLKQQTRCVIEREDGRVYEATNSCDVSGDVCPRVSAGSKTGEDYHLCQSRHAEANCAALAEESRDVPGKATLYGHTYFCKDCQDALRAANVNIFEVATGAEGEWIRIPRLLAEESLADLRDRRETFLDLAKRAGIKDCPAADEAQAKIAEWEKLVRR